MADTKSPNTLTLPADKPAQVESERKVEVTLLHDVWIEDKDHEESVNGIRRVRTNIPVLDENGNPTVDKKTKSPITNTVNVALPVSIAKKLIDAGKALRADPL